MTEPRNAEQAAGGADLPPAISERAFLGQRGPMLMKSWQASSLAKYVSILEPNFTLRVDRIIARAVELATIENSNHVGSDHLVRALLEQTEGPHVPFLESDATSRIARRAGANVVRRFGKTLKRLADS